MTATGDSIVMTILLSPETANYISLIGDIHSESPNSYIYFIYILSLFHTLKLLVSLLETLGSHRETLSFKAPETTVCIKRNKTSPGCLTSYLFSSTSKLAPSLQLNRKIVCFHWKRLLYNREFLPHSIGLLWSQSLVFHYFHY